MGFAPKGTVITDVTSPFYSTPAERLAQKTSWDKAMQMDESKRMKYLQDFYASDPDLMTMMDRTKENIKRENAKPLPKPTGPGIDAQAGAVNELRLLGVEDPYSAPFKEQLKDTTETIREGGYQNIVDSRTPVQKLYASNPQFLPDNNTLGTPYLPMGGTRNKQDLIQEQLFINPDKSAKSTEEQAAAVAETKDKLEVAPTLFTPEGDFVDTLYEQTEIPPDSEGFQHWVDNLLGGDSVETVESNFLNAASTNPASNNYVPPAPPVTPQGAPPVTPPGTPQIPAGQEGWWNQFADADAFKSFLQGDQKQTDKFDQFKEFMGLLSGMGGMFGGGGVPGFASGGVAAASPYNNFMGFMNAFKSLGGGSQTADITTGNIN